METAAVSFKLRQPFSESVGWILSGTLLRNASFLIASTVVSSGLGAIYWLIAARALPATTVGLVSGIVAAMTVTALASNLGITYGAIDLLPKRRTEDEWSRMMSALVGVGSCGAVLGAGIAVLILATWGAALQVVLTAVQARQLSEDLRQMAETLDADNLPRGTKQ